MFNKFIQPFNIAPIICIYSIIFYFEHYMLPALFIRVVLPFPAEQITDKVHMLISLCLINLQKIESCILSHTFQK